MHHPNQLRTTCSAASCLIFHRLRLRLPVVRYRYFINKIFQRIVCFSTFLLNFCIRQTQSDKMFARVDLLLTFEDDDGSNSYRSQWCWWLFLVCMDSHFTWRANIRNQKICASLFSSFLPDFDCSTSIWLSVLGIEYFVCIFGCQLF